MKAVKINTIGIAALAFSTLVACTSLPKEINAGIKNGDAHAYYEAGKHVDSCKAVNELPLLVQGLCIPIDLPLWILQIPRVESIFCYRSFESRDATAAEYFKKGADMGDADCKYQLGCYHYLGYGVKQDKALGIKYLTEAAALGHAKAKEKLSTMDFRDMQQAPEDVSNRSISLQVTSVTPGEKERYFISNNIILGYSNAPAECLGYVKMGRKDAVLMVEDSVCRNRTYNYQFKMKFDSGNAGTFTAKGTMKDNRHFHRITLSGTFQLY